MSSGENLNLKENSLETTLKALTDVTYIKGSVSHWVDRIGLVAALISDLDLTEVDWGGSPKTVALSLFSTLSSSLGEERARTKIDQAMESYKQANIYQQNEAVH